jgi:hypothetical protein
MAHVAVLTQSSRLTSMILSVEIPWTKKQANMEQSYAMNTTKLVIV